MSILPQLEHDLLEAAERRHALHDDHEAATSAPARGTGASRGSGGPARRLRLAVFVFVLLLATATITLAATGVILTGAPVRPEGRPNPSAGEGVPSPGASRLLPIRVADPEGGLPWGMRVVRTTRGELCLQIGRIQDGRLGELGIDGVFHDDGRFHPIPAAVLPETTRVGRPAANDDETEAVSCQLAGEVLTGAHLGVDRSAGAANGHEKALPKSQLRDIYFGVLGEKAVSVSYQAGAIEQTESVVAPIGAYMIVKPARHGEIAGVGYGSLGSGGQLVPSAPLTAITYRIDGQLCKRGPVQPPGVHVHVADPCPQPHQPAAVEHTTRDLNLPLHVQLRLSHERVTGARVSFTAPFAVTSANQDYTTRIPSPVCRGPVTPGQRTPLSSGYSGSSLNRDVPRGATVTFHVTDGELFHLGHFVDLCGRHSFDRTSAVIEVVYLRRGSPAVMVGRTTVREPSGARP
jgi:hypothetical protein